MLKASLVPRSWRFWIALLSWGAAPVFIHAADDPGRSRQAVVISVSGRVEFQPARSDLWYPVATNHVLLPGDYLRTLERSRATLLLSDRTVLPVGESSTLQFLAPRENVLIELFRGVLSFFHRDEPGRIELRSGGINASVRGTEFAFSAAEDGTVGVTLYDGEVVLSRESGGELQLNSGDIALAPPGQAPRIVGRVVAGDWTAVQWSLSYPVILDPAVLSSSASWSSDLEESRARFEQGDLEGALNSWPANRTANSDGERILLAALLLSAGSVAEAEESLSAISDESPMEPLRTAHQQLIEMIRRGAAIDLASKESSTALLAESYGRQSERQLEKARDRARDAVRLSPEFGYGWVRLAELEFVLGEVKRAEAALEQGRNRVPEYSGALVLAGYLSAARNRLKDAHELFDQALASGPGIADAWLGRGLVSIRQGNLKSGREDLLVAAGLEPQRAVLRSYLGKALADSELLGTPAESDRARHELSLAKQLDPGDPTAWLYSALLNQQN